MPRVIIPERNTRYNTAAAEHYGPVIELTDRRMDPLNPESVVSLIGSRLSDIGFEPETDYVCLTGHQLITALFLSVVSARYGAVRLLMFDARSSSYCERLFNPGGAHVG